MFAFFPDTTFRIKPEETAIPVPYISPPNFSANFGLEDFKYGPANTHKCLMKTAKYLSQCYMVS